MGNASSLGVRIKMCLRVRLYPNTQGLSIVSMLLEDQKMSDEVSGLLELSPKADADKEGLLDFERKYREIKIRQFKLQKTLKSVVVEYLLGVWWEH